MALPCEEQRDPEIIKDRDNPRSEHARAVAELSRIRVGRQRDAQAALEPLESIERKPAPIL